MPVLAGLRSSGADDGRRSRRQSSFSDIAKAAMRMNASSSPSSDNISMPDTTSTSLSVNNAATPGAMAPPPKPVPTRKDSAHQDTSLSSSPQSLANGRLGFALNDTPLSTAPSSPNM